MKYPVAHQFDEKAAKEAVEQCPDIVKQYIFLLEKSLKAQRELTAKAVSKLIEANK